MRKFIIFSVAALLSALTSQGQIVLDTFNSGSATGAVVGGTSWVGQVTQNANTITVGGTAGDVNGWGATSQTINATGLGYVAVTAQRDSGNVAAQLSVRFSDDFLNTEIVTVNTSSFNIGSLTTVYIPVSWTSGIDVAGITSWTIGGGSTGTSTFHMTFDNLALTASAVPEPSTYALMAGLACFGLIAIRRRLLKA